MKVLVVGAGLAGLSAACHLRGRGYDVTVVERDSGPGGRGARLVRDGFTFDTGPTVMTMPDLVQDALSPLGVRLDDVVPMRRLDPGYRAIYSDGSEISVRARHEDMRAEIARTCGGLDAAAYDDFVIWLRQLYRTELPNFIDANFDTALDLVRNPGAAARLVRLGAFGRLGAAVDRYFTDPRLSRLFSFQALYAGLPPKDALAVYAVITYMDSVEGVWFPEGGMGRLPAGMAQAAEAAGVRFRYDAPVASLLRDAASAPAQAPAPAQAGTRVRAQVRAQLPAQIRAPRRRAVPGSRVRGVRLTTGEELTADAVVMTVDLPVAYRRFLPDVPAPRVTRKGTYSPSAVVWHLGVRGLPDESIRHHNIHFGDQWDEAFDALMRDGRLMPDPSRLVSVPSLSDPSLAPDGCSTLYVLEPVPNLSGHVDWRRERAPMRARLLQFLQENGYPTDIVTEEFVDPLDWERLGMEQGTPFALAHLFSQTGPFRPGNIDPRVPGLIFAGSGTVPGVGVPMVLISGKLAADRVDAYLGAAS